MKTETADHQLFMGIAAMSVAQHPGPDAGGPRPSSAVFSRAVDNAVNNTAQDVLTGRTALDAQADLFNRFTSA